MSTKSIDLKILIKRLLKSPLMRINQSKLLIFFIAVVMILLSYCIAGEKIIHNLSTIKIIPMIVALLLGGIVVFINVQITKIIKKISWLKYPSSDNVIAREKHKKIMQKGKIWILRIFSLCCLEEVVFRYFIISKLITFSFSVTFACLISSFFFAILHLKPGKLIEYTFLGIIFASIFILTDNIIYSIVAHFVNNFIIYIIKCKIVLREESILIK